MTSRQPDETAPLMAREGSRSSSLGSKDQGARRVLGGFAKTLYVQMLRGAFEISNVSRRPSSPHKAKQPKTEGLLFRGSAALPLRVGRLPR